MSRGKPHGLACERCGKPHEALTTRGHPMCQKHSKRTKLQCGANALKGRDACHTHVGKAKARMMLEDVLGGLLLKGYLAVENDGDLIHMREQNRIWRGREREIIGRITADEGESGAGWRAARSAMARVKLAQAMGADGITELLAGLQQLDRILMEGAAREASFDDLEQSTGMIDKCSNTEIKRLRAEHQMLSMDKVLELATLLTHVALKRMETDEAKAAFLEDLKLIQSGEEIVIEADELVFVDEPPEVPA